MKKAKPAFFRDLEIKFIKRRFKDGSPVDSPVSSSQQIHQLFKHLENETKERLICISLDTKRKIICFEVVAIGSLNSVYARPIEVIRGGIAAGNLMSAPSRHAQPHPLCRDAETSIPRNPSGFIVVHNHPSGDPTPSDDDKRFTLLLRKGIETLGCKLYDHIIIGDDTYFSFADADLLK